MTSSDTEVLAALKALRRQALRKVMVITRYLIQAAPQGTPSASGRSYGGAANG